MKTIKKFLLILLSLLLCGLSFTAAAATAPDLTRPGSLSLEFQYQGQDVTDGALAIYRVGDIVIADGECRFELSAAFADSGQDLMDLQSPDTAAALQQYAEINKIAADQTAVNSTGTVQFSNLTPGLYLVLQTTASAGYSPISSFLVSVPWYDETKDEFLYDVVATSKLELIANPSASPAPTPTPKPDVPKEDEPSVDEPSGNEPSESEPSELPQTGQLNWPIPVLSGLGLMLCALGVVFCAGRRKKRHEK